MVCAASGPAIEAILMMRPALRSMKYGAMALQMRNTDLRLTAKVRSQSSSVFTVKGMPGGEAIPALFTRMSIRPSSALMRSKAAPIVGALGHVAAHADGLAAQRLDLPRDLRRVRFLDVGDGDVRALLRHAHDDASPMPAPPPVTTATLPASLICGRLYTCRPTPLKEAVAWPRSALRSRNWFGRKDLDGFAHRSWIKAEGFSDLMFDGRPVIGIANSWSELTNCNAHLRSVAEAVKRGVLSAGGFPLEFPTISLGEVLMKPTTMLFRNLMAMDVEECIRAYPLDGVVLLSGCDKTTPAMLMGAASADVPAIMVTGGPMLRGIGGQEQLGSGTDTWRLWAERRAGRLTEEELCELESCMSRSAGHCMVMGTASTMASMARGARHGAARQRRHPRRRLAAPGAGRDGRPPHHRDGAARASSRRRSSPRKAFDNAIRADMAIGGSTNAIIHLVAIAGRAGVPLPLTRFDELSRTHALPGQREALRQVPDGGLLLRGRAARRPPRAPAAAPRRRAHRDRPAPSPRTSADAENWNPDVIRPLATAASRPRAAPSSSPAISVPDGAVLKQSAASPHLLTHRGRAVVFEDHADLHARIDDPDLAVDETSVLVLKRVGPKGAPGHARVGRGAHPAAPPPEGRQGHGADLGRADERDVVRHGGAARLAGGGGGRAAGAGARRRRDRARRP